MKLAFIAQRMMVASVNARAEAHGEEKEPAGDLGLSADLPNDVLSIFHPGLKPLLYEFNKDRPLDLAEQGRASTEGYLPHLRFQRLKSPLHWEDEMTNVRVRVRRAGDADKNEVSLFPAKVNKFAFEAREGGTISLGFRVQYKPDEKQAGRLAMLVQQEVEVTLEQVEGGQVEIPEGEATAEA